MKKRILFCLLLCAMILCIFDHVSVFAITEKCIGPITVTTAGARGFDFGMQSEKTNDTFTVTVTASGTVSAQIRARNDGGCFGGANHGADCTVDSQCPNGACKVGTSGKQIPLLKNTSATALPAITATGFQQFDGPWNTIIFDLGTCTTCSVTYNICGKEF